MLCSIEGSFYEIEPYISSAMQSMENAVFSGGILFLLLLAVPIARWFYVRFYLRQHLYFEPWTNLSNDDTLNIGASLSEILFFELEKIRKVLQKANTDAGLWNEKSSLPVLERAFEGYPTFVRHVELLGLSGRLTKLLRLVLLARPQSIRGTIHKFGRKVRFQVVFEGARGRKRRILSSRSWAIDADARKEDSIPEAVSTLAHMIVLDLAEIKTFKSPSSFLQFTQGLQHHLFYYELNRREELGKKAQECYRNAIKEEGHNALASYNIAEILYSSYEYQKNEEAIREYQNALRTDVTVLRARAFRGLANAYCQRRQRHERGGDDALRDAIRSAKFARESCDERDRASILKALAYATQVQSDRKGLEPAEKEEYVKEAMKWYEAAIETNPEFTIAHNNLGYLYLERAIRAMDGVKGNGGTPSDDVIEDPEQDLDQAEACCKAAVGCDVTYPHAYDNLGNISKARAGLRRGSKKREAFEKAEGYYHKALSYDPGYTAAFSDLAELHILLASYHNGGNGATSDPPGADGSEDARGKDCLDHMKSAWGFHWRTLSSIGDDPKSRSAKCAHFLKVLETYGLVGVNGWADDDDSQRWLKVECGCHLPEAEPAQSAG